VGLFGKPKHSYFKLQVPAYQSFLMPDPRVMQKDAKVVAAMADHVIENLETLPVDLGQQLPTVATLERQLVGIFAQGNEEFARQLAPGIFVGTRAGYLMGVMENHSGVSRHDGCETHYWTALILMRLKLTKGIEDAIALQTDYSFAAGYYLGRKGDIALNEIVSALVDELKTMAA